MLRINNLVKPLIWYIHGANSSSVSFAHIKSKLPAHEFLDISYDHSQPASKIVDQVVEMAKGGKRPIQIVGHSLGGIIALAAFQQSPRFTRAVTLASPFGGSRVAAMMRWLIPSQLLDDIHPNSDLVTNLRDSRFSKPVLSVVTTAGGSPLISEENDGVVTVKSQLALEGPTYVSLPVNHFEVLLTPEVPRLIKGFLF